MKKKVLSVLLAAAMVAGLAACGETDNPSSDGSSVSGSTPGSTTGSTPPSSTAVPTAAPTGYQDDGKTYSYRMGPADIPESWNVHTYQSNSSTYVLDYTSEGLYTFDYNDDMSGFKIVPSMASGDPVDVSAEYVGKYGVEAGETGKVYKIPLKTNLKFDNGEPITAQSFVDSMKLLLNPAAANFRADNMYQSGTLKIYNSEQYVKQGSSVYEVLSGHYEKFSDAIAAGEKIYVDTAVMDATFTEWFGAGYARVKGAGYFAGYFSIYAGEGDARAATEENFFDKYIDALMTAAGEAGTAQELAFTAEQWQQLITDYSNCDDWNPDAEAELASLFAVYYEYPALEYDGNVGFFADKDGNLVLALKNAMDDNFYLRRELCSHFFLVYAPLYESLITDNAGVYGNTYGTSIDTFVGYGPYKLVSYTEGAEIILERNEYWHGYTPEDYIEGTYMTDRVVYNKVEENATRREMFEKGELDSYGLQAEDMADYQGSDYTYYNDSESTWYLAMNPGMDSLKAAEGTATPENTGYRVIKTVLMLEEFRQALSWSVDRAEYNLTLSPTSGIATALLSSMIVADPESGLTYRSLDEAKDAILNFWGLADAWGAGKEYATRDDAIASITGYDPNGAKALFKTAYDKAVEEGYISAEDVASGKWEVQICIGIPVIANYYSKGYDFLKANWTKAVEGTPFEGHLTFVQSQELGSTSFGSYLRNGSVDMLFGVGYGGDMFNPYSMIQCFTDSLQYDPFTSKDNIYLDIDLEGKTLRASLADWANKALQGDTITAKVVENGEATDKTVELSAGTNDAPERRIAILAAVETKVLTLSNIFPMSTDASASLRCMRVQYKTEDYIVGMGRGGITYYTYAMDDQEFADYVKSQGGVLNYK